MLDSASVSEIPANGPPRLVHLPQAWNPLGWSGLRRYALNFDLPDLGLQTGWGLYIPRAGNRFHVTLNGRLVARFGDLSPSDVDHAQQPHFVYLPVTALRPGSNELVIDVYGETARYAGLSQLTVGPPDELRGQFLWRDMLQNKGSFAMSAVALLFALAALPLAWRQRDRGMALFVLTCIFCALRTSYAIVESPPLPYIWWNFVTDLAYTGYLVALSLFCMDAAKLPRQPLRTALWLLMMLSAATLPVFAFWRMAPARQVWLTGMLLYALLLCLVVIRQWWRLREREAAWLAMAGAGSVALGVHDHVLVFFTRDGYGSFALARFSLLLFLATMGWVILERRRAEMQRVTELRGRVQGELSMQRQRLEQAFDEQQRLARHDVQQQERDRILRDIHDGMGLQLQALLAQIESGPVDRGEMAREVRTAIEQMRMLVSNVERFEGDALMLFGQIRHQIERRLRYSGIRLQWDALAVADGLDLSGERGIALQRLMFELTTNVIRHARARLMHVELRAARQAGRGLLIAIRDDGIGFDVAAVSHGTGQRSLMRRLQDLGAVGGYRAPESGGTLFELHLPDRLAQTQ